MRRPGRGESSVAQQILLLQALVVLLLVAAALGLAAYDARRDVRDDARDRAVAVARAVADAPSVRAGVQEPATCRRLQPYAERVRQDSSVDFVVVMGLDRTRCTHPVAERIGEEFVGDRGDAPQGGVFTQEYTGTLGPSMRAVVPVRDGDEVVGLVSVGITVERIEDQLRRDLLPLFVAGLLVLGVGVAGAWLVSRRLRRQTHGMGPGEITRMYEYYDAVLHAVREGLLLLDTDRRVQLANDEARRLLGLADDVVGRRVDELGLPPALVQAATEQTAEGGELYAHGDRVLVVGSAPATWQDRVVGSVVSLRDRTELQAVTGELDLVRGLTESLRSQNHEAANRLHAVVSLIETGRTEEAIDFATEELQVAQLLADRMAAAVEEPVLAALLLGKSAEAAERGIRLDVDGHLPAGDLPVDARELLTVVGNLVDNAMDAVSGRGDRRVSVRIEGSPGRVEVVVGDSGPGIAPEDAGNVFERGWSTKSGGATGADRATGAGGRGIGLALVGQVVRRTGGSVSVGRSPLGGAELTVVLGGGS